MNGWGKCPDGFGVVGLHLTRCPGLGEIGRRQFSIVDESVLARFLKACQMKITRNMRWISAAVFVSTTTMSTRPAEPPSSTRIVLPNVFAESRENRTRTCGCFATSVNHATATDLRRVSTDGPLTGQPSITQLSAFTRPARRTWPAFRIEDPMSRTSPAERSRNTT